MYASPIALKARSFARKSGALVALVGFYRSHLRKSYEAPFERLMMQSIGPSDVIWDVGANVGVYTALFAAKAAQVVAFEPSPQSIGDLRKAVAGLRNAVVQNVALSSHRGTADFFVRTDGYTGGESLTRPDDAESVAHTVQVWRGDDLDCPTMAKIDVEGFEPEVLEGMAGHLANPRLRALFIEVHFEQLERRGLRDAPVRIVAVLKRAGFRIRWPDPSHIVATR